MPATERAVLQEQLIDIILEVLKCNPQLHYYQGYHDVAVSLLLVVGERMAIAMLDTLSNYHLRLIFFMVNPLNWIFCYCIFITYFLHISISSNIYGTHVFFLCRDFMDPTMDSTKHILNYLMPILEQVDTELYDFMIRYTLTHTHMHKVLTCAVAAISLIP